ncbi:MAG: hypothetical protein ABJD97_09515 [Betaproteobacteria bacterium]
MLYRLAALLLFIACLWFSYAEIAEPWWRITHGTPSAVLHPVQIVLLPMGLVLFGAASFVREDLEDAVERWYGVQQVRSGLVLIAGLVVGACALAGMRHSADQAGFVAQEDAEWSRLEHVVATQVLPDGIVFTGADGHRHPLAWTDITDVHVEAVSAANGSVDAWWVFQDRDRLLHAAQAPDANDARQVAAGLATHLGPIRPDPVGEARRVVAGMSIQPNHWRVDVWPNRGSN